MSERELPIGTPVVLKKPLTGDVGWRDLGTQSFSMGRVCSIDGDNWYGVEFEGLNTSEGISLSVPFKRDQFILARAGT